MKRPLIAGFLLACTLAPVAVAQTSPAGVWDFKTDEMSDACTMSGEMTIKPAKGKLLTCTFKAVQSCRSGLEIHTEQSCQALQIGNQVTITSRVDRIASVKPPSMMEGMIRRYAPDNFMVAINPAGDAMDGQFESMGTAPVKFRRRQDLTS